MTLTLLPDTLLLARSFLATVPELTDAIGDRLGMSSPQDTSTPWVRLTRIGGSNPDWMRLDTATVQIDTFAPPEPDGPAVAMRLARIVSAALHTAHGYSDADGVICDVKDVTGLAYEPDMTRTPPFPRVLLTVAVTAHAPEVSP
jgi:hypothetical protein